MKLSEELVRLEDVSEKLAMHLHSLRDRPELDYARSEAQEVADRVSYLAMMAVHGDIPEAEFADPKVM